MSLDMTNARVNRITRYFNQFDGSTSVIAISLITVDRIVMDVYPVTDNTGLPTGAPAVTANEYQTIDFAHAGAISDIGKNGAAFFEGKISNVVLYNGGSVVGQYSINENGTNIVDSIGGSDGTLTGGSWALFQEDSRGGDWLGQELITQSVWENPSIVGSEWAFNSDQWTLTGTGAFSAMQLLSNASQPSAMKFIGNVVALSGDPAGLGVTSSNVTVTTTGAYSFDLDKAVIGQQQYRRVSGTVISATIDKPSIKELLKVS